jgi:homoserine kinase
MSRLHRSTAVEVQVPATSANLGPGFDCLGLALGVHDHLIAAVTDDPGVRVDISGEGAGVLPTDESHLVIQAAARGFDAVGEAMPGLLVRCANSIPQGRGMGSSAAAIIAGLLIARNLVVDGDIALPDETVLDIATDMEGHPDNVAAALLGGFTAAWRESHGEGLDHIATAVRPVHSTIAAIVAIPTQPVATAHARGLLCDTVTRDAAVFNIGRVAALSHALETDPSMLFTATEDRLHQDERAPVYPGSHELLTAWRSQGLPAVISGAGPTVLVLTDQPDQAHRVMSSTCGDDWQVRIVDIDVSGARCATRSLGG